MARGSRNVEVELFGRTVFKMKVDEEVHPDEADGIEDGVAVTGFGFSFERAEVDNDEE